MVERLAGEAAETSAPAAVRAFDLDEALGRCYDRRMFQEMVEFFSAESSEMLDHMRAALQHADGAKVAWAAHRLRGTVLYLGAAPVLKAAERVEQAGTAGDLTAAAEAIETLEVQIKLLKRVLAPYRQDDQT